MKYSLHRYTLLGDLNGKNYRSFLKKAFAYSDFFSVSVFKSVHRKNLQHSYFEFLEKVEPFRVLREFKELPQHYERGQKFLIYELNDQTKKILLDATDGLYHWLIPNLPEDLSFFRHNKVWFNSITHAGIAAIVNWDEQLLVDFSEYKLHEEYQVCY